MVTEPYDASEQAILLDVFKDMLKSATKDGGNKRAAGIKPPWWCDPDHEKAIYSHLNKWKHGELRDSDSGAHPLVHLAWRSLAIAYQETYGKRDPVENAEPVHLSAQEWKGITDRIQYYAKAASEASESEYTCTYGPCENCTCKPTEQWCSCPASGTDVDCDVHGYPEGINLPATELAAVMMDGKIVIGSKDAVEEKLNRRTMLEQNKLTGCTCGDSYPADEADFLWHYDACPARRAWSEGATVNNG